MKDQDKMSVDAISTQEVEACITTLQKFIDDPKKIFHLEEEERIALVKAAGKVSRPSKAEYKRSKKDAQKAARRKQIERDKHARKETGIRSAREDVVFQAPKLLAPADLSTKETGE